MLSPFSMRCGYKVKSYPYTPREPGYLSERDEAMINLAQNFGAAAFFQYEQHWSHIRKNKIKKQAKALSRCGLLALHKLESDHYRMNVCTPGPFPGLENMLRSMAFFQLYLRLQEIDPNARAIKAEPPLYGVIILHNKEFPVIITRIGDYLNLLSFQIKDVPRLVIVAEEPDPAYEKISCEYRVAIDNDLLNLDKKIDDIFFTGEDIQAAITANN